MGTKNYKRDFSVFEILLMFKVLVCRNHHVKPRFLSGFQ